MSAYDHLGTPPAPALQPSSGSTAFGNPPSSERTPLHHRPLRSSGARRAPRTLMKVQRADDEGAIVLLSCDLRDRLTTAYLPVRVRLADLYDTTENPALMCIVALDGHALIQNAAGFTEHSVEAGKCLLLPATSFRFDLCFTALPGSVSHYAFLVFDAAQFDTTGFLPMNAHRHLKAAARARLGEIAEEFFADERDGRARSLFAAHCLRAAFAAVGQGHTPHSAHGEKESLDLRHTPQPEARFASGTPAEKLRAWLHQRLLARPDTPPLLDDLASELGMSSLRVKTLIRDQCGTTYTGLIQELRLNHAKHLLAHSPLKVENIALACGYGHLSNFSRAFTTRFGCTPTKWRAIHAPGGKATMGRNAAGTARRSLRSAPPAYANAASR